MEIQWVGDLCYDGLKITVLQFYTGENFDFSYPTKELKKKGFVIERFTTLPTIQLLQQSLKDSSQMWIISTSTPNYQKII
jgi:hypothetical protein